MNCNKLRIPALVLTAALSFGLASGCGGGSQGGTPSGDPATGSTVAPTEPNAVAVSQWDFTMLSAVTGPIAYVGKPAGWSVEYAAKLINEAGGIRGVPVNITVEDTAFDAAKAVTQMTSAAEKSLVVFGPMDAPGAEAAGQVSFDAGVANIAAFSFQDIRDQYSPYAIGYMTDSEEGDTAAAGKWVELNPDLKKIVVFYTPTDASQVATLENLKTYLPTVGAEVVGSVEVQTGQLDCSASAIQGLNMKADGYFMDLRADEAAKVVNELRKRGVDEGRRICATFACYDNNYFSVIGENGEGSYIWQKLDPNYDGAEWKKLVEAYKADFEGQGPTAPPVPDFYNALMAVKQAIEELELTGDPAKAAQEREALANWLNNSPEIQGIQGKFQWVNGKKVADIHFFQVTDGQPVAVK